MIKKIFAFCLAANMTYFNFVYADSTNLTPPNFLAKQDRSIDTIKGSENKPEDSSEKALPSNVKAHKNIPTSDIRIKIGVNVSDGDLYLPLAGTLCIFMNEDNSESCRIQKYMDHTSTINGLLNGDVDFIITSSLVAQQAVDGKEPFDDKIQSKKFRSVASVFNEPLLILARRESQIKHLDDLKLASVNIPTTNTKSGIMLSNIMNLKKWSNLSFKGYSEMFNSDEQIKSICNNSIDVIAFLAEPKSKQAKSATRLCEINIVNIGDDDIDLFKKDPQYAIEKVEGGTYLGSPLDIETVAGRVLIMATSDTRNSQVEHLLQIINAHIKEMRHLHVALKDISIPKILNEGRITQIHDGVKDFVKKNKYESSINIE